MNAWCLLIARAREISPESAPHHTHFMSMMLEPKISDVARWTYLFCSERPTPPSFPPGPPSLCITGHRHTQPCLGNARPLPELHRFTLALQASWLRIQSWLHPEGSTPVIPDKLPSSRPLIPTSDNRYHDRLLPSHCQLLAWFRPGLLTSNCLMA